MIGFRFNWGLFCLLILLAPICLQFANAGSSAGIAGYIYGYAGWSGTELILRCLSNANYTAVLNDLYNATSSQRFLRMVEILRLSGIQVTPPELCINCLLHTQHFTWPEIVMIKSTPLAGFFSDGRLKVITIGNTEFESLSDVLNVKGDNEVKVFAFEGEYSLSDRNVLLELEKLFLGEPGTLTTLSNLLPSISLLALADSVNPCTFAVFTALLFMALHALGRKKAALTGMSFIMAIFISYFVLGLGGIQVLAAIPHIKEIVALAGFAVGSFSIARGLDTRFRSPVPKLLRRFMEIQVNKSYVSPIASFVLGAVASFTLLPCSGGPYVVGVSLLSTLKDPPQAYFLLIVYNVIFVIPLIVLLFVALSSREYVRKMKALRSRRLGLMELISGLLLVAVCIYLLLS